MKPLDEIPDTLRQSLRGIFSDIDDTITTNGMLSAEAYSAIENISKMKKRDQKAIKNLKKLNKRFSERSQDVPYPAINSLAYLILP